jgi:hypothetical protein
MIWPEGASVVTLACKGGRFAKIVEGRWLVRRCRERGCRSADGEHTYHIWDIYTGRVIDHCGDPIPIGTLSEGETSHAIR